MGIAIGLMGLGLTTLGVVFAYIWKSNGKLQRQMMSSLEHIEDGQKEIAKMVKDVAQMVVDHGKILERMEARLPSK